MSNRKKVKQVANHAHIYVRSYKKKKVCLLNKQKKKTYPTYRKCDEVSRMVFWGYLFLNSNFPINYYNHTKFQLQMIVQSKVWNGFTEYRVVLSLQKERELTLATLSTRCYNPPPKLLRQLRKTSLFVSPLSIYIRNAIFPLNLLLVSLFFWKIVDARKLVAILFPGYLKYM